MNSIWNKNIDSLKIRFPLLYSILSPKIEVVSKAFSSDTPLNEIFTFWDFRLAKSQEMTVFENGAFLHSSYAPSKEAASVVKTMQLEKNTFFFCGFGLGYLPIECAKYLTGDGTTSVTSITTKAETNTSVALDPQSENGAKSTFALGNKSNFANKTLIIVEPDVLHLLASFAVLDWSVFFKMQKCSIITDCDPGTVIQFIEKDGINDCQFFFQKAQTQHARQWFDTLNTLIERNKSKHDINSNTLEKFANLWLKNSCKNLQYFPKLDGINIYKNLCTQSEIPFVVLAAGPSLQDILPHLAEIKKRAFIVCVDTALRAVLRQNVEPDFIIIIDPQYYAACHILGLSSSSSVLITEGASYPSVYRFKCRKTVLCSSLFPLGQFFEKRLGENGKLDTGGSVATCAWDFAKFCGSKAIYTAGLDLSYPEKQTHIKGSTFEQKSHFFSNRITTSERADCSSLLGANLEEAKNYEDNLVLTDSKMKMFAWWFESKIAKTENAKTYTFSKKGLLIPGISYFDLSKFLQLPDISEKKITLIANCESSMPDLNKSSNESFLAIKRELMASFDELYKIAKKGKKLCDDFLLTNKQDINIESQKQKLFSLLDAIDKQIMTSSAKDAASLVFPSEKKLFTLMQNAISNSHLSQAFQNIKRSQIIYNELCISINKYQKELSKHFN